jgi:GT2 family glycosyltransferase
MTKAVLGMVTFGCLEHTKNAVASVADDGNCALSMVVGKPKDTKTAQWCDKKRLRYITHSENRGFACGVNDIIEEWKSGIFPYLIVMGNDVVVQPGAIAAMIEAAEQTDADIIDATGEDEPLRLDAQGNIIADIFNLTLFKRSAFEAVGYLDVNFWPCYFVDNDYLIRAQLAGLTMIRLGSALYRHARSATMTEEHGKEHHERFRRNRQYFCRKWAGMPTDVRNKQPFGGEGFELARGLWLPPNLRIDYRTDESRIVKYWSSL